MVKTLLSLGQRPESRTMPPMHLAVAICHFHHACFAQRLLASQTGTKLTSRTLASQSNSIRRATSCLPPNPLLAFKT